MSARMLALRLRRLSKDTNAASAVEFALLLPLILLLLLGSFDVTRAVDANSKVTLLSRTICDFVTSAPTISVTDLDNIVVASKSVLYPYPDGTVVQIEIQSLRKKANSTIYQIDWSYPPANSTDRDYASFTSPDDAVVRTRVTYTYNLKFVGFLFERLGFNTITLKSSTVMAPRWGSAVEENGW